MRESIVDTTEVDPRLRGDDGYGVESFAGRAPFFSRVPQEKTIEKVLARKAGERLC